MVGVTLQNNKGTTMRQNLKKFKGQSGQLYWKEIPLSFREKLQKATPKRDLSNSDKYTFHYEIRESTSGTSNFTVHTNNNGYQGHILTLIYYYEIEGVNTSLNFYNKELGEPSCFFGMRFHKYKKCYQVPINKGKVITFGKHPHKPEVRLRNNAKNIKRYTLAIFVTEESKNRNSNSNSNYNNNNFQMVKVKKTNKLTGGLYRRKKTLANSTNVSPTRPKTVRSIRGTKVAPSNNSTKTPKSVRGTKVAPSNT